MYGDRANRMKFGSVLSVDAVAIAEYLLLAENLDLENTNYFVAPDNIFKAAARTSFQDIFFTDAPLAISFISISAQPILDTLRTSLQP